ncbi:MAG: bifunctional UDP-N-acetylglucosamine diphosphorylase/glucosamine-1-phosphate N-acetyltransferase GlmU [Elusimicrobiales bacterium]|nr:bifunctional UDP-N-acetylglucosamine diphosphorylase/glucosamine-1-phosphate N-acetyltransferase GlmU [Elusimicrobiales bacterium]
MTERTSAKTLKNTGVLILAAGLGTRMKSALPKVLHPAAGRPLLGHVMRAADALGPAGICVVAGHKAALVREAVCSAAAKWGIKSAFEIIEQRELTGSGRAVIEAREFVAKHKKVLVLCGDAPLVRAGTLAKMAETFAQGAAAVVLTAEVPDACGYGRIVRGAGAEIERIVEEANAGLYRSMREINSGVYLFDSTALLSALAHLKPNPPKNEYYLTDAVEHIRAAGGKTLACLAEDYTEVLGINSRKQLAEAEKTLRRRKLDELMDSGVTITDPETVYIDDTVSIAADTMIYPGTHIYGATAIASGCAIGPNVLIRDCEIGGGCNVLLGSLISESVIAEGCNIGPYSHIRPQCAVEAGARIGNFSELKKSKIGAGSKVPHLSYIGDTDMGPGVNIGAGTITCNYDGAHKHKTVIGEKVFVGSNVNLVAPVNVGAGAKIGAGSTITDDVPAGALAIARARQITKERKH